jgi:hypothetical protein
VVPVPAAGVVPVPAAGAVPVPAASVVPVPAAPGVLLIGLCVPGSEEPHVLMLQFPLVPG